MYELKIKRAYQDAKPEDGYRILVDRLWPRGIRKEKLAADQWAKAVAPSSELRKWFGHDPEKFDEFARKYREELSDNVEAAAFAAEVQRKLAEEPVTFVYGARDETHNHAMVLRDWVLERIGN